MTASPDPLARAFAYQIDACEALGSPFSARVLRLVAADLAAGGPFAVLAAPWVGLPFATLIDEATSLRVLGGLHYLVLSGLDEQLGRAYPPDPVAIDDESLARLLRRAAQDHEAVLCRFLVSPPQTNEVRRSLCLVGGFLAVAQETGLPLRCLEIGASAGLNLNWDRYHYEFGRRDRWGEAGSPLTLSGEWRGPPPRLATARVVERAGCDQRPIDPSDDDSALRLQAYVWADQADRLERMRLAIGVARENPVDLDAADAGAWAESFARPRPGTATVLFHSVVQQYLPADSRARLNRAIAAAGESATAASPFAWLRMEPEAPDSQAAFEVRLTQWPGGAERLLGRVHPHGARVCWLTG